MYAWPLIFFFKCPVFRVGLNGPDRIKAVGQGLFVRNAYIRFVNLLVNIFCSYLAYLRSACANVP